MRSTARTKASLFIASNLLDFRCQGDWASQIHRGLVLNRAGNRARAEEMFACILQSGPREFQSRAALALGSNLAQRGELNAAIQMYHLTQSGDLLTRLSGKTNIISIIGMTGDHRQALTLLEQMEPLVMMVGKIHPILALNWLNSQAVALLALGRVEQAGRVFTFVNASRFQLPEWRDTAREIEAATPRGLVSVPRQAATVTQIPTAANIAYRCEVANYRLQRVIHLAQGDAPKLEGYVAAVESIG